MITLVKSPIQGVPNGRNLFIFIFCFIKFEKSALSKISVSFIELKQQNRTKQNSVPTKLRWVSVDFYV